MNARRRPVELVLAESADASAQEFRRRTGVEALPDPLVGAAHAAWLFTAHGDA